MTDPSPEAMERAEEILMQVGRTMDPLEGVRIIALALDEKDREIAEAREAGKRDGAREMREVISDITKSARVGVWDARFDCVLIGARSGATGLAKVIRALPLPGEAGPKVDESKVRDFREEGKKTRRELEEAKKAW